MRRRPRFPNPNPFPFWLIGDWPDYLSGLLRLPAAEEVASRIGWLLSAKRPKAPADGWWNYEPDYLALGFGRDPVLIARLDKPVGAEPEPHRGGPFPIAEAFRAALAAIPEATPVVLLMPPVYAAGEPPPARPARRPRPPAGRRSARNSPATASARWWIGGTDALR